MSKKYGPDLFGSGSGETYSKEEIDQKIAAAQLGGGTDAEYVAGVKINNVALVPDSQKNVYINVDSVPQKDSKNLIQSGGVYNHTSNSKIHISDDQRQTLNNLLHNKGFYMSEQDLKDANPSSVDGDYATVLVNISETNNELHVFIYDSDDGWTDTNVGGFVSSLNGKTGDITLTDFDYDNKLSGAVSTTIKTAMDEAILAIKVLQDKSIPLSFIKSATYEDNVLTLTPNEGDEITVDIGYILDKLSNLESRLDDLTYVAPALSVSFTTPTNNVLEIGTTQSAVGFKCVITKNTKDIEYLKFYTGNELVSTLTDVTEGSTNYPISYTKDYTETTTFKFEISDTKNVISKSLTLNFVYPYYYGVSESNEITSVDGLTKLVQVKGNKTLSFTADNKYCVFAYPASYGNLTSILDPNGFENLNVFTKTTVTIDGVLYNVYTTNTPVTCNAFKYTFK